MKKVHIIYFGIGKNTTSWTLSSTIHLEGQTSYFTVLYIHTIKLYKIKIDSKFIKSNQCSLERSQVVLTEINLEFWSRPTLFLKKKKILVGLLVTKIYKNRTIKISLFNYSMLRYVSPITNNNLTLRYL